MLTVTLTKVLVEAEFALLDEQGNVVGTQASPKAWLHYPHGEQLVAYLGEFERQIGEAANGKSETIQNGVRPRSGKPEGHSSSSKPQQGSGRSTEEGQAAHDNRDPPR